MTKRALAASGFVALFAVAGCSSDAAAPSTPSGTAGAAGAAVGGAGAPGAAGATMAAAGAGGAIIGGEAGAGGGGAGGAPAAGAGGAPSGGTGGASGGAGGTGGGSAGSAGAGGCAYKYCEDFEGAVAPGAATGSDWKIDVDKTSTVDTVTTKAHGGTHSQHFKVGATSVHGYITETKSLALAGTSYWGRVWVWDDIVPTGHIVNIAIDGKSGAADEQVRIFNVINGSFAINRRSDDKGGVSNVKPMAGKWQCYEWHITPNSLDIYVDNAMLMNVSQTWANPTVSLFRMGFERFTDGNAGEMWMDDLAMNDTQIGCK